mgnify:FL=1
MSDKTEDILYQAHKEGLREEVIATSQSLDGAKHWYTYGDKIEEAYNIVKSKKKKKLDHKDFYLENGKMVLTEEYHIKRGSCCGGGCKHCPFWPQYVKLNKELRSNIYNNNETPN